MTLVVNAADSLFVDRERNHGNLRCFVTELAWRIAEEPVKNREAAKKLTGEWIIYLPRAAKNYYLSCGTHKDDDQMIYDRIIAQCVRDFPELPAWLKDAQNS